MAEELITYVLKAAWFSKTLCCAITMVLIKTAISKNLRQRLNLLFIINQFFMNLTVRLIFPFKLWADTERMYKPLLRMPVFKFSLNNFSLLLEMDCTNLPVISKTHAV